MEKTSMKTRIRILPRTLAIGVCALLVAAAHAAEFYADDEESLAKAIGDAADSAAAENYINLDRASIETTGAVIINGRFGPTHRLTVRPRPGLSTRPRTQIRASGVAVPIVDVHGAGYVTLQDLDLLRTTFNRAHLLDLENVTNVVVERCRVGSV